MPGLNLWRILKTV